LIDAEFTGASVVVTRDRDTKRVFLYIAEGTSNSLRVLDVTKNSADAVKLTTLVSAVGVYEVSLGRQHELIIFDANGVMSSVDVHPSIPCGNQWEYVSKSMKTWNSQAPLRTGVPQVIHAASTVDLRRASAAKGSPSHPWQLMVQKKKLRPFAKSKATLVKNVVCSRRVGIPVYDCCVIKETVHTENISKAQMQKLQTMLVNL